MNYALPHKIGFIFVGCGPCGGILLSFFFGLFFFIDKSFVPFLQVTFSKDFLNPLFFLNSHVPPPCPLK